MGPQALGLHLLQEVSQATAPSAGGRWDDRPSGASCCACRSLGVTLWELFELGTQPYEQHTDRQVLAYAVRDQQLKLPPPQLPPSLSERW